MLPLSKAVVATMVLFYAVSFWNSWFSAFLYMDRPDLFPVTVYLRNLIAGATGGGNAGAGTEQLSQVGANIQSVTIVLTALPILCRLPVRPELLRLGRDARRGQGLTAATVTRPADYGTREFP